MNPVSNLRQLVYVMNALCKVDCLLADLQLKAKDELAESEKAERALLILRLELRKGIADGFGIFGDEGETDEL
jgi:hypothetical protein|nr:MAG TPA: hypothetical protein [Caudoviricetes sp.]